jgi:general secretion pathway protein A
MYLDHFRLQAKPFSLAFEPLTYYPTCHQEAMNDLRYTIEEKKGLATLVGRPGTGKTALLNNLMKTLDANVRGLLVSDVALGAGSLLRQLMTELGLLTPDDQTLPLVLRSYLQDWLLRGKKLVLLVDEAQSLRARQLEEIRYLTNLELQGKKLVEIVMAGQPSLEERLLAPQFEALRQRIAVRTYLEPLSFEQLSSYIQWRLQAVGATNRSLFDRAAVQAVRQRTQGIPRLVNLVCDRALLLAYADDSIGVEASAVEQAANELGIDGGISTPTGGLQVGQGVENFESSVGTDEFSARLSAIERKLDILLEAMAVTGFSSVEDENVLPPRSTPNEAGEAAPRVAKIPRRHGKMFWPGRS